MSSSKLVFIWARTWRAMGAGSRTAFSKWASLSFILSTCGTAVRTVPKILKMAD